MKVNEPRPVIYPLQTNIEFGDGKRKLESIDAVVGGRKESSKLCRGWTYLKRPEIEKCSTLRFASKRPCPRLTYSMSRGGGRGGRGGGRGGIGGGRGGFGAGNLPPMGLTFADIQSMSREATALYPVCSRMLL